MFVLSKSKTYFWPVAGEYPDKELMVQVPWSFEAEFLRLSQTRINEILAAPASNGSDLEFSREVVVGWRKVIDAGQEVPFSSAALEEMICNHPGSAKRIVESFFESIGGSKLKN